MSMEYSRYQPTEDVEFLLDALRGAYLAWIAEEIEETIREGKSGGKQEPSFKGMYPLEEVPVPFDRDEQRRIALRTIQRYVLELSDIWEWTQAELRDALNDQKLEVSLAFADTAEGEVILFSPDSSKEHLLSLDDLLRRLWPEGPEPYDIRKKH